MLVPLLFGLNLICPSLKVHHSCGYWQVLVGFGHQNLRQNVGHLHLGRFPLVFGLFCWFPGNFLAPPLQVASVFDAIKDYIVQPDDESIESRKLRERRKRRRRRLDDDEDEEEDDRERLQLPIFSYFALVVGYCAIGSLLFNWWEKGAVW